MPEPLMHRATERQIRALLTALDEAAGHIAAMGCTCVSQSEDRQRDGHQQPCTGYDTARKYWALTTRIRRRAGVQEPRR